MRKVVMVVVLGALLCGACSTGKEPEEVWVLVPTRVQLTDGSYVTVSSQEEFLAIPEELRGDEKFFSRQERVYR